MTDSGTDRPSHGADRPDGFGVAAFLALAFAISWAVWVPAALGRPWPLPAGLDRLVGAFGPSLAAVVLVAASGGLAGVRRLLGRLLVWRVPARWYAVALLLPAAVSLAATAILVALGSPVPDYSSPPVLDLYPLPPGAPESPLVLLPFVFAQTLLLGSPMGEELGWRGYALPRLQWGLGALAAGVALGVAWGVWHLPLLFVPGDPLASVPVPVLFVGIVADSVLFVWLFNNTRGSLLLALLFHAAIAVTGLFVATPAGTAAPVVEALLKWLVVAGAVWRFGPATLAGATGRVTLAGRRSLPANRR